MNSKNLLICCIILIIGIISICSIFILNQGEETWITVMSDISIYNGDEFKISLDVLNGTELPNKQVEIIILGSNGEKKSLNSTTNDEGLATFIIDDLDPGNYTVNCLFHGCKGYKSTNVTTPLEIKEKLVSDDSNLEYGPDSDFARNYPALYHEYLYGSHYHINGKCPYDENWGK